MCRPIAWACSATSPSARKRPRGQADRAIRSPAWAGRPRADGSAGRDWARLLADAQLALLDLDRFKAIHASIGDDGGDTILLQTARRLNERFGDEAQIFRIGGDGFALLFAEARSCAAGNWATN